MVTQSKQELLTAKTDESKPDQDDRFSPKAHSWKPKWLVDVGNDCKVGITTDDGCFVVLYEHNGGWRPGTHIPKTVAERIGQLKDQLP